MKKLFVLLAGLLCMSLCTLTAVPELALAASRTKAKTHTHRWQTSSSTYYRSAGSRCMKVVVTTKRCSGCGKSTSQNSTTYLSHSFTSYSTIKPATCQSEGSQTRHCRNCGYTETRTTARLSHRYGSPQKSLTYRASGNKCQQITDIREKCSLCGDVRVKTTSVLVDHSYSGWKTTKAATCESDGTKTRTCKCCGYVEKATEKKLGHNWVMDAGYPKTDYEAVSKGCEETTVYRKHCTRCKKKDEGCAAKLGPHAFGAYEKVRESTCKQEGEEARTCRHCGYTEFRSVPKSGHSFTSYDIINVPNCHDDGLKERSCIVCGYKESVRLPKYEHSFQQNEILFGGVYKENNFIVLYGQICSSCGCTKVSSVRNRPDLWKIANGLKKAIEKGGIEGTSVYKSEGIPMTREEGRAIEYAMESVLTLNHYIQMSWSSNTDYRFTLTANHEDTELRAKIDQILKRIIKPGMNVKQKSDAIASEICRMYYYSKERPFDILTAINKGRAKCFQYAVTYQFMCQRAGLDCLYVVVRDSETGGLHAINNLYCNQKWLFVDVTWTDSGNYSLDKSPYYLTDTTDSFVGLEPLKLANISNYKDWPK